jgi:cytochrome c1
MKDSCKTHTRGDGSWWEKDARGIPLCRVCYECRKAKLARYRRDVLTDPNYWADEQIEED